MSDDVGPDVGLEDDAWRITLERFSAASGLSAAVFDARAERRQPRTLPTKLLELLGERGLWREGHGDEPGIAVAAERELVVACVATGTPRRALVHDALLVEARPITFHGERVGAYTFGWAFERFGTVLQCERLAPLLGMTGAALWREVRMNKPTSPARFAAFGDLLAAMVASNVAHAEAVTTLRALSRTREVFLAHVSHELRSPLAAVSMRIAQQLRTQLDDPAAIRQALENMQRNCADQERLIEDLIESARTVTGQLAVAREPVRLADLVARAVESLRPRADGKRVALTLALATEGHADGDAWDALHADAARLGQVFVNLIGNAVKFTPADGEVRVSVARVGDELEVRVADTGPGIDAAIMPRIFEPFVQALPGSHQGLGIGLSVARRLVLLHDGTIDVANGANGGAVFVVRLPALKRER